MKKRVMCVHDGAGKGRLRIYEGKDGTTGITTTEEAAGFAASFFDEAESYGHCSGRI